LAEQEYNLGNRDDWFMNFRGGHYGTRSRLYGVVRHYREMHAWLPVLRTLEMAEYNLATIFFHMDSAIECFTFALNALGHGASDKFRNVGAAAELKKVSPRDIIGAENVESALVGYAEFFPTLQRLWDEHRSILATVQELHDVSKHRQSIYTGGQLRNDPPEGFFDSVNVVGAAQILFAPPSETLLRADPKGPWSNRQVRSREELGVLEDLAPRFSTLMNESFERALADARATISIPEHEFRS
jgi:hypothetical protein